MKKVFIISIFLLVTCKTVYPQKYVLETDSIKMDVETKVNKDTQVIGFLFRLINLSDKQIYFVTGSDSQVSCFVNKVGNSIIISIGEPNEGFYDYHPTSVELKRIERNDTVLFVRYIVQPYSGKIPINFSNYQKSKKYFNLSYFISNDKKNNSNKDMDIEFFDKNKHHFDFMTEP